MARPAMRETRAMRHRARSFRRRCTLHHHHATAIRAMRASCRKAGISIEGDQPCRRRKRWILPVCVFGNCVVNTMERGYLKGAMVAFTCSCKRLMVSHRLPHPRPAPHALPRSARARHRARRSPRIREHGMREKRRLHLRPGNVVARGNDHVIGPRGEMEIAVLVLPEGIPREIPALTT